MVALADCSSADEATSQLSRPFLVAMTRNKKQLWGLNPQWKPPILGTYVR